MSKKERPRAKDFMSPKEMNEWLAQELRDLAKANELRTKEASDLAASYAAGDISAAEAEQGLIRYGNRWGEALCGATALDGTPDEAILKAIDKARQRHLTISDIGHSDRIRKSPRHTER